MKTKAICIIGIVAALFCARPANAEIQVTLLPVGGNVVATATGMATLTGLSFVGPTFTTGPQIAANSASLVAGDGSTQNVYTGISGPSNFGTGSTRTTSIGTGNPVGIFGSFGQLNLPFGYTAGAPLSGTATWTNTTLAGLGVTPNIYTWTWGNGADSLTLFAGVEPVPEPVLTLFLALAAAGLLLLRTLLDRKRIS